MGIFESVIVEMGVRERESSQRKGCLRSKGEKRVSLPVATESAEWKDREPNAPVLEPLELVVEVASLILASVLNDRHHVLGRLALCQLRLESLTQSSDRSLALETR